MENAKISSRQFIILVASITIGDSFLVLPSIVAVEADKDAWIAFLVGFLAGLLIIGLFITVGKLFPRLTLVEYNEKILGSWPGRAVSLALLLYFFLSIAAHVREIGDFMTTEIMLETPIQAIHLFILIVLVICTRLGLETLARAGELFFPSILVLFSVLVIFLLPRIEFEFIQPVMEAGFKPVIRGSLTSAAFPFMELVGFHMILPAIHEEQRMGKSFMLGAVLGGIVLAIVITLTILVLGGDITARQVYPSYSLAKQVNIGRFLQRIEAVLAFLWIMTTFLKLTLNFYVLLKGTAQLFRLKNGNMISLPFGMLLFFSSILVAPNIAVYNEALAKYWPFYDFTFAVLLPLLLLAVYAVRKKKLGGIRQ